MISKIVSFIVIVSVIVIVFVSMSSKQEMVVTYEGNMEKKPIEIKLGHFHDSDCGMPIKDISYASQVISKTGKTWFFHDHGGIAHWMQDKDFKDELVIWVWAKDTKRWIDGREAFYTYKEETPMSFGFGAYENELEDTISFDEMYLRVLRKETLQDPYYRGKILGGN